MSKKDKDILDDAWFGSRYPIHLTKFEFLFTLVLGVALVIVSVSIAHTIGYNRGKAYTDRQTAIINTLPSCQRDEVLYPDDYKGPGKNVPSDYECQSYDEAVRFVIQAIFDEMGVPMVDITPKSPESPPSEQ